jgi:hypothetical protein
MTFRRGLLSAVKWIRRCQGKRRESMSLRKLASVIAPATSVTVITVVRQLVAAIAKGFIVAKDNYRISAKILRDNKILHDSGLRSAGGRPRDRRRATTGSDEQKETFINYT